MGYMKHPSPGRPHTFHIPVMGTGFSIDTPLRVAKYGISSVISLFDDVLIEQMRRYHSGKYGKPYEKICDRDEDARANRITAYLDLLNGLIRDQVEALQSSPFEPGSEITRYFEMLPDSQLRQSYVEMLATPESAEKTRMQDVLRHRAVPGSIDVNIMTKVDRDRYRNGNKLPQEFSDAMAALRGYAKSILQSSIIFSAGVNRHLFGYLSQFDDFFPDDKGVLKKKIVLKVSDFRSAMVQGKLLAKKGLWVSEYRIESGLDCGGHAFASSGYLMGPILDEFCRRKSEFIHSLHEVCNKALAILGRSPVQTPQDVLITVQGGIGTADEDAFLLQHYDVDSTGWGTPFLLVPEVTNVDEVHLEKLLAATDRDVYLSDTSPLGIPYWNLRTSASEQTRRQRIGANKPGSPCPKGYLVSDTEFTEVPICRASRVYQKNKLEQLSQGDISAEQLCAMRKNILAKSCICHDLAGGATLKHDLDPNARPALCCGPNIVNFSRVVSLEEMVGHIYGRLSLLTSSDRPHMFIRELMLYIDYFRWELQKVSEGLLDRTTKWFLDFKQNLIGGIEYYRSLAEQFSREQKERFLRDLETLSQEIENILSSTTTAAAIEGVK
ncbi:MAG: hypothetical protein KAT58_07185 [candidate division Zixibacteria bacterium]|nr:hypothetical protein [candidate division Zixibacteria bacterium]